jgi:NAD-specific glutamate dehydrogenase
MAFRPRRRDPGCPTLGLEDGVQANWFDRERAEVVERVQRYAQERLGGEQAELFLPFVGQYYGRIGADDLTETTVPDLYGAALAHLRLARTRRRGEPKVAVYSPDYDEHGFASPHTVVEVVTDDMPFLVDSLTLELRRHGLGLHVVIHPVLTVRRNGDGELLGIVADTGDKPTDDAVVVESYTTSRWTGRPIRRCWTRSVAIWSASSATSSRP